MKGSDRRRIHKLFKRKGRVPILPGKSTFEFGPVFKEVSSFGGAQGSGLSRGEMTAAKSGRKQLGL
jgi:hypothetical protein